ncbi:YlxR family protein [Streptomyces sp. DSM 44917]|uniref:YlxR family protein n=1 Tax=Streptomyces boetiae TaxID=3075541 RepID=A0ABU2LF58_9ACTN|nr:YlxR family protein [Streptomyces sp. DSM 44917]MDT0310206.1 YlxR family protein [Streptomyces sp. DSM 44917]
MSGRTRGSACPERTCVGCRQRSARDGLLRVVMAGDRCVPDLRGTLPGRGAYLHPVPECLELAVRRRAFPRALRVQGPLDCGELRRVIGRTAP